MHSEVVGERGVFPSKFSIPSNWKFLGTRFLTSPAGIVDQKSVQVLSLASQTIIAECYASSSFVCGREGAWSRISYTSSSVGFLDPTSSVFSTEKTWLRLSSPHASKAVCLLLAHKKTTNVVNFVGERGLEPPLLAELVPKTSVSTIPPLAHMFYILTFFSFIFNIVKSEAVHIFLSNLVVTSIFPDGKISRSLQNLYTFSIFTRNTHKNYQRSCEASHLRQASVGQASIRF